MAGELTVTQRRRRLVAELRHWSQRALDERAEPGQRAAAAREVDRLQRELELTESEESQRPAAGAELAGKRRSWAS